MDEQWHTTGKCIKYYWKHTNYTQEWQNPSWKIHDHYHGVPPDGSHHFDSFSTRPTVKVILKESWTLVLQQKRDWHIMNDAWTLNLNVQTLTDANNIWLYLHINMLSEITDHIGTTILQSFYNKPNKGDATANKSGSQLQWPHQPCPGKWAWRAWQQILNWLYLKTNCTEVASKLGPWIPKTINLDWTWNWKI